MKLPVAIERHSEVHARVPDNVPHRRGADSVTIVQVQPLTSLKLAHAVAADRDVRWPIVGILPIVGNTPAVVVHIFPRMG